MAAIDKIYVDTYEKYLLFKKWCEEQPPLVDKYGKKVYIEKFLFTYNESFEGSHPIFSAPYYVDAYIIRNCPFDFIQEEMMIRYGYWSQKRIKEFYEDVKNWGSEKGECPYWAKLEDFIALEDGTMTIKGLGKSDYELIKESSLYNSPSRTYKSGKHFQCIHHPVSKFNSPYKSRRYFISVDVPNDHIWCNMPTNTWDFYDEFVDSDYTSSTAFCRTIRALKRRIRKWKLPIGAVVTATARYDFDTYKFIVTT